MAYFSTAASAPECRNPTGKNRVWEIFPLSSRTRPANRRPSPQPRRKILPTPTKSASGIPYWPSRDPIEEEGGHNLYSFVSNDPVEKFDLLGMVELTFAYITRIELVRITFLGSTFNGGIKTTQTVSVDPDQCTNTFSSKSIGTTIKYASPTGSAVDSKQASGSTIKQSVSRPNGGSDQCKCVLKMSGNEGNPFVPGAPGITYHVTITFDAKAKKYEWEVQHDSFPSHKLTGHTGKVLLDFSHVAAGTSPWGLYYESESASGNESW